MNISDNIYAYNVAIGNDNTTGFMLDLISNRVKKNSGCVHCLSEKNIEELSYIYTYIFGSRLSQRHPLRTVIGPEGNDGG